MKTRYFRCVQSVPAESKEMMAGERLKRRAGVSRSKDHDGISSSEHITNNAYGVPGNHLDAYHGAAMPRRMVRRRRVRKGFLLAKRYSIHSFLRKAVAAIHPGCNPPKVLSLFFLAVAFFVLSHVTTTKSLPARALLRKVQVGVQREMNFQILFPAKTGAIIVEPPSIAFRRKKDYGGLKIENPGQKRVISDLHYLSETEYRPHDKNPDDDGNDAYYAFDDDVEKRVNGTMNSDATDLHCRRTSNHQTNYQNCNTLFESDLLENQVKYLNAGSYRQVFSLQHSFLNEKETIVVKDMYEGNDFTVKEFEFVRMDAMVAERLTSSKRIYDIYGFCGLSILSEFFPHGDIEDKAVPGEGYIKLTKQNELKVYNDIPIEQKLSLSLQMAEAIADLHGDPMGTIVHQDIQLSQFLLNEDKTMLKLNDFNRAEFMLWDDKENDYCKYSEGHGNGNWRSPEEYYDYDLNEQVDVFSFGNNMYSLLTGLWVFFDDEEDDEVKTRVQNGEKAYIDPRFKHRSLGEAKLAEIIDLCHAYNPQDRPSIFEVVDFLREALKEVQDEKSAN